MRFPSLKTLKTELASNNLTDEDFRLARAIGTTNQRWTILAMSKDADNLARDSFGKHPMHILRLTALNEVLGMHGVEVMQSTAGEYAEYLNAGDLYVPSIIRWRGVYRVQSLGDFVETMERHGIRFK